MNNARRWAVNVIAGLVVAVPGLVVIAPAESATIKSVSTTLWSLVSRIELGKVATLRGTTSQARRYVVLQKRVDGRWRRVARTRSSDGRFRFAPRVRNGRNTFRAVSTRRVLGNGTVLRRTVSRGVTVRGVDLISTITSILTPTVEAARLARARINGRRAALGLQTFSAHSCLTNFAVAHSQRMKRYGVFEHSSHSYFTSRGHPSFANVCSRSARPWRAEIIALVHASSPQEAAADAYAGWMSSPPHRSIIEDRSGWGYQVGVGFARSADGRWWATAVTAYNG